MAVIKLCSTRSPLGRLVRSMVLWTYTASFGYVENTGRSIILERISQRRGRAKLGSVWLFGSCVPGRIPLIDHC